MSRSIGATRRVSRGWRTRSSSRRTSSAWTPRCDAVGPGGLGAAGRALDDEEPAWGEPAGPQPVEHGAERGLVEVVRAGRRRRGRPASSAAGSGARCAATVAAHDADAGQPEVAPVAGDDVGRATVGLDEHDARPHRGEAASSPSAPEPAYRSSTRAPRTASRASRAENTASRTRSLVGRVPDPGGVRRVRPPAVPAMTRVISHAPGRRPARRRPGPARRRRGRGARRARGRRPRGRRRPRGPAR